MFGKPKFLSVSLLILLAMIAATTTNAKYVPYVEPLDGDWGGVANPWQAPGGFSTILYGRMGSYGDVDVVAYEFIEPTSNWMVETAVPVCGEHFAPFAPVVAVIGTGLPDADLPFDLPEGMGAVMLDRGNDVEMPASENYLFTGNAQRFTRYSVDTLLPTGDYLIAIWEPNGNVGAYALSMLGVHPDYVDAMETNRIDEAFNLVNSGAWMGQDCSAPLASAECSATAGHALTEENKPPTPERWVIGEGYVLSGVVRDTSTCLPIAHAQIRFWMANPDGVYDGDHEGALYTNGQGGYRIESDPPGNYGPDTRIHLNISAPGYQGVETEWMLAGEGSDTFEIALRPE